MSIESVINEAGKTLKTVVFDYTEADGSNEGTREVEPYSYREKSNGRLFYGYDLEKGAIRSFVPNRIRNIIMTDNSYEPRWDIEV